LPFVSTHSIPFPIKEKKIYEKASQKRREEGTGKAWEKVYREISNVAVLLLVASWLLS